MNEPELTWLAETAQKLTNDDALVMEVGSWCGRSTMAIAKHLPQGSKMYCVDAWKDLYGSKPDSGQTQAETAYACFMENFKPYMDSGKVIVRRADSVKAAMGLAPFWAGTVDWVFLDSSHTYETTKAEIRAYLPLLRAGGLLSGHDYWHEGVSKAVNESLKGVRLIPGGSIWTYVKE
jgi:predicted O-methyltransferase YrrM